MNARLLGPADDHETFTVTIILRRRPDGPPVPDPTSFLAKPLSRRPRMSDDEFAAKYGAAPDDLQKVTAFAKAQGLQVVETNAARRSVVVSGTVAQMNKAFAVTLGRYQHATVRGRAAKPQTEIYRGRDGFIHVPNDLADIIVGVFGLDNRRITKRNAGDPPNTAPISLSTVTKLYDFPTNSAAGQTVAIFSEAGYLSADIRSTLGSLPTITDVTVDASNAGLADAETTQDICIAASAAPGAAIAVYFTTFSQQGWVDLIGRVVHPNAGDPDCSVLSCSFYVVDGDDAATLSAWGISTSWLTAVSQAFQDAAIKGVTICIASGDAGTSMPFPDGKAHVQYPASDPWVLSVGGTTIGNVSGTSFEEWVWNDNMGATGGGISAFFNSLPAYQAHAGVPVSLNDGHVGRGVPDVAANASTNSGYPITVGGGPFVANGTSAAAPLWAGLIAVINAALGTRVGFVNPALYTIGSSAFRDILGGPGPANNGFGDVSGYPAGPGWDACTGWGSINGTALLLALRGHGLPPGLAVFNNALTMAWKGVELDDRIFWSTFNGTSWAPQQVVTGVGTSSGVALAVFNDKLYMAWKGLIDLSGATVADDPRIWWSAYDGSSWSAEQLVPGLTSTGPRLAAYNNLLYAAWKGEFDDPRIWWSSFNGTTWAPQEDVPGVGTSVGPSLAVFQNALYAAWKGKFGDQRIWWSSFNGTTWAPQREIPGVASTEGPSLAVFQNALYAAWKGESGDQGIWWSSFNGTTWTPQKEIPGVATSVGPSLAVFTNALYAVWKGEFGDERIWWSSFNGTTWTPQQTVPGVWTNPDL
jgi:kumamolisin